MATSTIEQTIKRKLYRLVESTKTSRVQDVKYVGGNAISLLYALGSSFKGKDLDRAVLIGADLRNADLTKTTFRKSNLSKAVLSNAILNETDFSGADLSDCLLEQMSTINSIDWAPTEDRLVISGEDPNVKIWNIETDERPTVLIGHEHPVLNVSWSPVGQVIASIDTERNLFLWNSQDCSIIKRWHPKTLLDGLPYLPSHISRQVFFAKDGNYILVGNSQLLIIVDLNLDKPIGVLDGRYMKGEQAFNSMFIRLDSWYGNMDWIIRYRDGRELYRLQHKNVVYEKRSGSMSTISTMHLPESQALDTKTFIDPEFERTRIAEKIIATKPTTVVFSPSRNLLAYGLRSKVVIWKREGIDGYKYRDLDLSLSCDGAKIKDTVGIPAPILQIMRSRGVDLDANQWREVNKIRQGKVGKELGPHTRYLT